MISNYKSQIQQKKLFCCHPAVLLQMPAKQDCESQLQITNHNFASLQLQITNYEGVNEKLNINGDEGIKLKVAIEEAKDAEDAEEADVNKEEAKKRQRMPMKKP